MTPLSDAVADLLALRRNEPLLRALFDRPKATWLALERLAADAGVPLPDEARDRGIAITWLDDLEAAPGYALVLFVAKGEIASAIGVYHRARLERA